MIKAITDKYEMTEPRFWELVAQADWPKKQYDAIKMHYLKTINQQECIELRGIADGLWKMLDDFCEDKCPAMGSDDSHSDLFYHIIGLGKNEFYACMKNYELIKARGHAPYESKEGYEESFGYCLPYHDEAKNPGKAIRVLEQDIKDRINLRNNKIEINGKEYDAEDIMGFDMLMQNISDTLSEADDDFVSKIYNKVCSASIENVGDDAWRMK